MSNIFSKICQHSAAVRFLQDKKKEYPQGDPAHIVSDKHAVVCVSKKMTGNPLDNFPEVQVIKQTLANLDKEYLS